jgi:dGTPase
MTGFATPDAAPWRSRRHENDRSDAIRSSFAVDRDRIIHSDTFRELQHKTQVQSVVSAGRQVGFFRTRLNHVIEVAQIARGLAAGIGANVDLAEAIALAHDLGHPPFGHAGERGLSAALAEHDGGEFNANVHSLAVVDEIEAAFVEFPGLDLTWATREGIARHATPFDEPVSFGEFRASPNAGLEAQIVDAADVMAYLAHDIDDALRGRYIAVSDLDAVAPTLVEDAHIPEAAWQGSPWPREERELIARRRLVAKLIRRLIRDLTATTTERISALGIDSPEQVRACDERVVVPSSPCEALTRGLLSFLVERYYRSERVSESDAEAVRLVKTLFAALMDEPDRIPPRFREADLLQRVATYIASLNDRSAFELADTLGVSETVTAVKDL